MTLDQILTHRAPCYVVLSDGSMVYCQRLNAGDHPDKGPTVKIIDDNGSARYIPAGDIVKVTKAPPLP